MEKSKKKLVWLDCDPGHDDAMAIIMAATNPNLNLIGISTVFGNNTIEKTTRNALRVLKMINMDNIPVYKGAKEPLVRKIHIAEDIHGETGLNGCELPETDQKPITEEVYLKIYQQFKQANEKIHYVSTGSLTNLAILLKSFPEITNYIAQISIMGGAIGIGNWRPQAEFNIYIDPEAAQIALSVSDKIKFTISPIELTHTVFVTEEVLNELLGWNTQFGRNIVGLMNFFKSTYKTVFGFELAPLHDPVALYYVINPDAYETKFVHLEIDLNSKYCDGRTVFDLKKQTNNPPNVYLACKVDVKQFWVDMMYSLKVSNERSPVNKKEVNNKD